MALTQNQFSRNLRTGDLDKRKDVKKPPAPAPDTATIAPDAPEPGRKFGENERPMQKVAGDNLDQERNWSKDLKASPSRPGGFTDPYNANLPVGKPATLPRSTTSPGAPSSAIGTQSSASAPRPPDGVARPARGAAGWPQGSTEVSQPKPIASTTPSSSVSGPRKR